MSRSKREASAARVDARCAPDEATGPDLLTELCVERDLCIECAHPNREHVDEGDGYVTCYHDTYEVTERDGTTYKMIVCACGLGR